MHLLLADDYPDVVELLAEVLAEFAPTNITIDCAHDGAEALAMAIARPPAFAVLDINMPIMDGIDAAIAIRAALPDTPPVLIALTGKPENLMPERARLAFDHLLVKPPDFEVLAALLWPP